ncbi:MAG: hypothetical protein Q9200_006324 [Gallowayella weberi]
MFALPLILPLVWGFGAHLTCATLNATTHLPPSLSNIRVVPGPHGIQQDLGGQLSPEAKVYYPGNPGYTTATTRWSAASHPEFLVVVVPATDQDVVVAVATGACTCVGVVGAGLGGGLGRYQGLFGLVADNFLEMTVITASGVIHTVSENRNADLFWAMRGAGHNFGIVTSFEYKINDSIPSWYIATYIYAKEKLEAVFSALNDQNDNARHHSLPLVRWPLPFLALNPRFITKIDSVPYPSLADAVGTGINSPICKPGLSVNIFPTGILKFNLSTNRQVYNLYAELVTQHPGFAGSVVQFEAYSMLGIRSVKAESTAYAHREDNLLV